MTIDISYIENLYPLISLHLGSATKIQDHPNHTVYIFDGPGGVEFSISYINMGKRIPIQQELAMNDWKLKVVRTPFPRLLSHKKFDRIIEINGDPDEIIADLTSLSLFFGK